MKTILISTSKFGNPVTDYYKTLGNCFSYNNYKVIYIFDGLFKEYPKNIKNIKYYTWKNKRPTKISDFIFLIKIIRKERPVLCISNFGSTNVVSIVSFIFRVRHRINYIHTTSKQLSTDSKKYWIKKKILKYRKKLIYSLNNHLFTNSIGTKKDTITYYDISEKKISIYPLLIESSILKYKSFQERENSICIVGRLHPSKGHRELLYLFKNCLQNYPDLKLKIIGDGYLKADVIVLSKKLNINKSIIFTGNIPNEKINEIFSSSLISISASIDEAYGLVNIEALREGTPLICTKTAGSIDIINEGNNGLFIDLKNKHSLSNSLDIILNEWAFYSKNALDTFNQKYKMNNIEKHFEQMKKFI